MLDPGTSLGDFTIAKYLGEGAFGEVYEVNDPSGRPYALKLLRHDMMEHDERFRNAAVRSQELIHPNIVRVRALGQKREIVGQPRPFFTMDLISGGRTLSHVISETAPMQPQDAVELAGMLLAALGTAHAFGFVHRDVKPANVLIDDDGFPRLTDFDLLRADTGNAMTQTKLAMGTHGYAAPEVLTDARLARPASDIYSVGVILYKMLTGSRPDELGDGTVFVSPAEVIPDVPPGLCDLVKQMLALDPDHRPQAARQLRRWLFESVGESVEPRPDELLGLVLDGRFRLREHLGTGGTAEVYRAMNTSVEKEKAIKLFVRVPGDAQQRVIAEARRGAKITHESLVMIEDAPTATIDGQRYPYIVMELMRESARQRLADHGPIPVRDLAALMIGVAAGLGALHAEGLVHRDIKPHNLLFDDAGRLRITDFGIATSENGAGLHEDPDAGTADYAAPEQFNTDAAIDYRTDFYGLGVTIFELATGQLPTRADRRHHGETVAVGEACNDPNGIALEPLVNRLMALNPDDRFQSASDLANELADLVATLSVEDPQRRPAAKQAALAGVIQPTAPRTPASPPTTEEQRGAWLIRGDANTPVAGPWTVPFTRAEQLAAGDHIVIMVGRTFAASGVVTDTAPPTVHLEALDPVVRITAIPFDMRAAEAAGDHAAFDSDGRHSGEPVARVSPALLAAVLR